MSGAKLSARGECAHSARIEPSPKGRRATFQKRSLLILIFINCFSLNVCFASSQSPSLPLKVKTELCGEASEVKYNFAAGACLLSIMFFLSYL